MEYTISRTFDSADRVRDLTYPDGEVVRQSYHDYPTSLTRNGQLKKAESLTYGGYYFSATWYTVAGQVDVMNLGNGQTTDYSYDSRGRVSGIQTGTLQNLGYTYDGAGNVQTITDNTVVPAEVTTFTYDELDRLTGASGGFSAGYSYYSNGRTYGKNEGTLHGYLYQDPEHAHAVTRVVLLGGTPVYDMTYDANGNMLTSNSDTYTYDANNSLVTMTSGGVTTTFLYDGKGNLVKKSKSDGSWTVYVGGIYELHNDYS